MLAHRALGLPGGARGEEHVGELVGRHGDAEVLLGVVLLVGRVDEQRLDSGQGVEGLVERGGAAAFGQHEPALGAGERLGDATGREVGLDGEVHATGLEDREDGGHPVEVALGHHRDDTFAAQPPRQQGSSQPVGMGVELPVGPLPVGVHGRDGVRVCLDPLLEQLVHPAVRQLPAGPGEPFELEVELLGGEQALAPVLGIRIGGDQRERGEVVAGDPGGAVGVEHVGPVPQPQPAAVPGGSHPQHGVLGELAAGAGRIEDGLEQRPGQAQLASETVDREVLVRQELRLDPVGVQQHRPPRVRFGRQPAGQRPAALHGDVAGHDLALAGQHGQHLGVRGQEHRAERHRQLVGQPAQRRHEVVGDRRLVLGDAGRRIKGPPRDRGEPAGDEHPAPELAAGPG